MKTIISKTAQRTPAPYANIDLPMGGIPSNAADLGKYTNMAEEVQRMFTFVIKLTASGRLSEAAQKVRDINNISTKMQEIFERAATTRQQATQQPAAAAATPAAAAPSAAPSAAPQQSAGLDFRG